MRIFFFVALFIITLEANQTMFDYARWTTVQMYRHFYGMENQFYVDIGSYDSYSRSNTIDLHIAGWDGINIDASPTRLGYLAKSRKEDFNINTVVGEKDKFVTFYQTKHEGGSTIGQKFVQKQNILKKLDVSSTTLSDLCERYFYKTPSFLNLDIEGFGSQALMSNNWTNPLCRFEVILSQLNQWNQKSGLPLPITILTDKNYTKINQFEANQVFVANEVLQKYKKQIKKNIQLLKTFQFVQTVTIQPLLRKALNVSAIFSDDNTFFTNYHYNPQTSKVYLAFARINRVLDCSYLKEQNRRYYNAVNPQKNSKDRPIFVINYNPHRNPIVIQSGNYTLQLIIIEGKYQVFNLTIYPQNNSIQAYILYIFNHKYPPVLNKDELPIISMRNFKQQKISTEVTKKPQPIVPIVPTKPTQSTKPTGPTKTTESTEPTESIMSIISKQATKQSNISQTYSNQYSNINQNNLYMIIQILTLVLILVLICGVILIIVLLQKKLNKTSKIEGYVQQHDEISETQRSINN